MMMSYYLKVVSLAIFKTHIVNNTEIKNEAIL